ncbi:MAG: hypothetical protein AW07_02121 [Candidatus Accumulibacter sp. SK-11]|nr:MAG: hypothetical protein AW07_02121 [Candidatus Accumulibacter sp. SK-11]
MAMLLVMLLPEENEPGARLIVQFVSQPLRLSVSMPPAS